ncbi:unnamed protein product [Medioppia subpectinata]|uniref:Uncharacterized protein n=1 Tax=Medioppia subpectinata TaxID=1979941 RepID=A0A7R9Q424_9ACAR|nr:unnamed protein product [Medioppia subpectinata]CAG2111932.1 unnamed protein product [Medioppia subpectinata]
MVNTMPRHKGEETDSSSDEDDGNFKRRRRHSSDEDSNQDNSNSGYHRFDVRYDDRRASAATTGPATSRPFRVVDSSRDGGRDGGPAVDPAMIAKQRLADSKSARLTKYDDVFTDGNDSGDGSAATKTTSRGHSSNRSHDTVVSKNRSTADTDSMATDRRTDSRVKKEETTIEVVVPSDHTDSKDDIAGGDHEFAMDPRLRRQKKFEPKFAEEPVAKPNPIPLKERVHQLLNKRKPPEAYDELKREVIANDLFKYRDQLLEMARDWFPSITYNSYDPRAVYIETPHINGFQNLMRDIFTLKTHFQDFWETIIIEINKFIDESRIKSLPQLLARLRWLLVKDIRQHLIDEEVKVGIRASAILIDHRLSLQSNRDSHRRQFEQSVGQHNRKIAPVIPMVSKPTTSLFSDMLPMARKPILSEPVRALSPTPQVIPTPLAIQMETPFSTIPKTAPPAIADEMLYDAFGTPMTGFAPPKPDPRRDPMSAFRGGDKQIGEILKLIKADQYLKLVNLMSRHISAANWSIITEFGRALTVLVKANPKVSITEIFRKIHDSFKIYASFSDQLLKETYERFLKEFFDTTTSAYNVKEWLLMRDFTTANLPHIENNPYNERLRLVKHNVSPYIDYSRASEGLVVNYGDVERDVPLMNAKSTILNDPRVECRSDESSRPKTVKLNIKFDKFDKQELKKIVRKTVKLNIKFDKFDKQELKKIVRKVTVSSDESDDDN